MESPAPSPDETVTVAGADPALPAFPAKTRDVADCWNKIGVNGDNTCLELARVTHCRNCPVYSSAGAQLLNRELPADYRREWTEHFSREKKRAVPGKHSVVIFRIGAEWLALPTRSFQEVAEYRAIHSLPHRQDGIVLGVINFRGELLVCVSLSRLLGIEHKTIREKPCALYDRLIVAEWQGNLVTFPVHEVHGIHRYNSDELKEVPATVALAKTALTSGILGWRDKRVGCLDEELLFSTVNRSLS